METSELCGLNLSVGARCLGAVGKAFRWRCHWNIGTKNIPKKKIFSRIMFLLNFQKKKRSFRSLQVQLCDFNGWSRRMYYFFIQVQLLIHSIAQIFVIVFSNKQFLNRCLSSVFPWLVRVLGRPLFSSFFFFLLKENNRESLFSNVACQWIGKASPTPWVKAILLPRAGFSGETS